MKEHFPHSLSISISLLLLPEVLGKELVEYERKIYETKE
jgi:hypothetical protein